MSVRKTSNARVESFFYMSHAYILLMWLTACGKFALRALAQSLAREYQPQGIHVAHVVVDGQIEAPRCANFT